MVKDRKMILNKMDVLLAYNYNIVLIYECSKGHVIQTTQKLLESNEIMGLEINHSKLNTCIHRYHTQMV